MTPRCCACCRAAEALICGLLMLFTSSSLFGLTADEVLFYAAFEGSAEATLARGNGKAVGPGPLKFVKGVQGRAVVIGGAAKEKGEAAPSPDRKSVV